MTAWPLKKKYRTYPPDRKPSGEVRSRMWNVSHWGAGRDYSGASGGTKAKNWPRGLSGRTTAT